MMPNAILFTPKGGKVTVIVQRMVKFDGKPVGSRLLHSSVRLGSLVRSFVLKSETMAVAFLRYVFPVFLLFLSRCCWNSGCMLLVVYLIL